MEKSEKLKNVIGSNFDIQNCGNKSIILFYVPYLPFNNIKGCAMADSFYIASNKAYKLAREYTAKLSEEGFKCNSSPDINYKEAALKCGNTAGINTLIYQKGLGSRFAIGALEISETFNPKEKKVSIIMPCKSCNICVKMCPANALSGGFKRDKCIRQYMLKPEKADENTLKAFGCRLLGCDICQSVCPLNSKETQDMPLNIYEMLKFENLLKNIEENNLSGFAENFGANYCNKNSLLSMLLIAMGNSGDIKFIEIINKYINSSSERVKFAAGYALKQLKNNNRDI